jgi:ADP-ribose pyrophosphatase YjhB (NUDIX family)
MNKHSKLQIPSATAQQYFNEVTFTDIVKGKRVNFRVLKSVNTIPPLYRITSAAVVPFIDQDKIVTTVLQRGLDIPGGHVEVSDEGIVNTIKREANEEACLSLTDPLFLIGVISSDYKGKSPEHTTYMLITAGKVGALTEFTPRCESINREIVSTSEFLDRYTAGSHEMMEEIIARARGVSGIFFT